MSGSIHQRNKVIGVITARMGSTRLPGKVMKKICGKSVFAHHVERMRAVNGLSGIYLATDKHSEPLVRESRRLGIPYYEGHARDVLERHIEIVKMTGADAVLRVTCDMPLFDFEIASKLALINKDYAFVSNMTMIQGTIVELISTKALLRVHKWYKGEAITQPIKERLDEFDVGTVEMPPKLCRPEYRLTLDYPEDLRMIRIIYKKLYIGRPISLYDVYDFLDNNPNVAKINEGMKIKRCERYGEKIRRKHENNSISR